ncbi:ABC transporter substrate-binding protein [Raoultibacter timonensis]|uniref:ABC transporter substrate-binding protein n=1 Tax=Raoultibacter timonensis TaxID=1907662 RepID=A0ABN6MEP0_9ACTN|nr:ABC transporter substrate-binding protein [Raoultibacter timonensis]BDE95723.1 ABC transporter substrate-binding protein [Raoultibacter timonensis]BDF50327.1 ABC transporter substrate-binding protein [Raoultibacter timonensis]
MAVYTRRTFVKLAGIAAAGTALGGVLSACASNDGVPTADSQGGQATDAAAADQVIVAMNTGSEPAAGFDPFVSWGCGEHVHEPLIQSTLITTNTEMEFVNDLATSYEISDDGLTWTFKVRDDVEFSDGEPLTAEDVAFTINGIRTADAAEADLSMVDDAVALDDTTVELHLNKPFNALLYTLAVVGIVPAHAYGEGYGSNPIGSGRYMLEQWDKGQQVILTANPGYYGDAPKMKRVVVVFMEEDAALAAVNSGQVDIAFTSATYSEQAIAGYELLACKTVDSRGISLPTIEPGATKEDGGTEYAAGNAVTSDLAIRRAINYAVDRDAMIKNVLNGYGTPAYSVSDNMPWSSDDMKIATDREKAKSLLADAGWVAASDGILEKDGTRAAFDVWYASNDSVRQALAAEFANQMKEIGIEVSIKGGSWDDLYPNQFSSPILWGWGSNSPTEVYELNYSSGWGNYASYESETVDGYLDEALAQPDIADSYEFWQKAQWDGNEGIAPQGAATWVWLADVDHLYFKREGLHVADQKPHPHGHGWSLVNNIDEWSWA